MSIGRRYNGDRGRTRRRRRRLDDGLGSMTWPIRGNGWDGYEEHRSEEESQ